MTAVTVTSLRRRAPRARWSPSGVIRARPAHAIVAGLCMLWLVPTVGLFVNSFRPPPWRFTLQNYGEVLGTYNLGRGLLNSLVIAIPGTVIPVTVAALAAYALTWMPFRGRRAMVVLIVGLLVVPVQMTLLVERPKIMPGPPVARHTASPRNARTAMFFRSWATMPTHAPSSPRTHERKSHDSNFCTIFSPGMETPCSSSTSTVS